MVYQGPTNLLCREKILQVLPKILHVLGKFVRIDNWSLYVRSYHKDSLGLVYDRQRLIMLVSKNDMTNGIEFNSSASSKMEKKLWYSWTPGPPRPLLKFSIFHKLNLIQYWVVWDYHHKALTNKQTSHNLKKPTANIHRLVKKFIAWGFCNEANTSPKR